MSSDYDRLAEAYARHRRCHPGVLNELASGLGENSRVLELGAGTGNYVAALRDLVGCPCTAVEPSAAMLEVAEGRGLDVHLVRAQAEKLPFDAGSFDFAFCVNVIHHVKDRPALFSEAFRVLDRSGTLCVVTESTEMIRSRFPLAEYFPDSIAGDLARYPRIDALRKMAENAAFSGWRETSIELAIPFTSADVFEAKAFSSLHFVPEEAFQEGLSRLKADLARGPMTTTGGQAFLWATK